MDMTSSKLSIIENSLAIKQSLQKTSFEYVLKGVMPNLTSNTIQVTTNRLKIKTNFQVISNAVQFISRNFIKQYNIHKWKTMDEFELNLEGYQTFYLKPIRKLLFKYLLNLKILSFEFQSFASSFNEKFWEEFFLGFVNLKKLRQLNLNFRKSNLMTDTNLLLLGNNISKYLAKLESFKLSIAENEKIKEEAVLKFIIRVVRSLGNLKEFVFDVGDCVQISEKTFNKLMYEIAHHLTCLEKLTLEFWKCKKIQDKNFKSLEKVGKSLPNLKHLVLNFNWCHSISEQGLEELAIIIALNFPQIKKLGLYFGGCGCISEAKKSDIKKALDFIPKVIIF